MEAGERVVGVNGSADERPQRGARLLQVRGVFKSFGGTEALADVGMTLKAGEILALLGENGAGKSTLIKILAGVYALDAGQVSFRGVDVTHALRRLPIAFIHQDLGLIDWMTVAENICMTLGFPRRLGMIDAGRGAPPRRRCAGRAGRRYRSRRTHPESEPHRKVPSGDRACARGRARDSCPRRADRKLARR